MEVESVNKGIGGKDGVGKGRLSLAGKIPYNDG
jgi:hypothetical protein